MKTAKISDMTRGWFIGNFEPSVLKTEQFEVGILRHQAGESWPKHYHAMAVEYNVLIQGRMKICEQEIVSGDIFYFEPNDIADPEFLEDCIICCVKTPSVPGDKHEVL